MDGCRAAGWAVAHCPACMGCVVACRQDAALDRPTASDPRWHLDNPDLWRCAAQPYEAWVCGLAYALRLRVSWGGGVCGCVCGGGVYRYAPQ